MAAKDDRPICKGRTWSQSWSSGCDNKSWKDGYCKIHHPERRKEKAQKREDEWRRKREAKEAKREYYRLERETKTAEGILEFFLPAIFSASNTAEQIHTSGGVKTKEEVIASIINLL